jgi:hypothetical protein
VIDAKAVQARLAEIAGTFKAYLELQQKATLSRTDKRRLKEFEAQLSAFVDPVERSDFVCHVELVGSFFGVTPRTVQNWANRGCPKLKHGLYDLKAVVEWWVEHIVGADSQEIEGVKLKYWTWKAEKEKVGVERCKEELIPRASIAQEWALRVAELTAALTALIDRLPPLLVEKPREEVRRILDEEIWQLRDQYAREGRYCPKQ